MSTLEALRAFQESFDRAWTLGSRAYGDLREEAPQRAAQVHAVLARLRRALTDVQPEVPTHQPAGLGIAGVVGRGLDLDLDPALRPFADAAREVEQLWLRGLDVDGSPGGPDAWQHLVARLPVPDLPPLPRPPAGPEQGGGRRWWRRRPQALREQAPREQARGRTAEARADLRAALADHLELLQAERVRFTGGVRSALGALDDASLPDAVAFAEAAQAWGSAFRGAGTLSDLVLDRDTFEERRAVNEHKARLEDAVDQCLARGLEASRG